MRKIKAEIGDHRVETGALQINDDWPGLFVRGDDCLGFKFLLEDMLKTANMFDAFAIKELIKEINSALGVE